MSVLCIEIKCTENIWKDIHQTGILGRILNCVIAEEGECEGGIVS